MNRNNFKEIKKGDLLYSEDTMFYNEITQEWDCGLLIQVTDAYNNEVRGYAVEESDKGFAKLTSEKHIITINGISSYELL